MATDVLPLFASIGLSEQKAKETAKNEAVSANLKSIILEVYTGQFCPYNIQYIQNYYDYYVVHVAQMVARHVKQLHHILAVTVLTVISNIFLTLIS